MQSPNRLLGLGASEFSPERLETSGFRAKIAWASGRYRIRTCDLHGVSMAL